MNNQNKNSVLGISGMSLNNRNNNGGQTGNPEIKFFAQKNVK